MLNYNPIIQSIKADLFSKKGIDVSVLRLDLIHPEISGNKWFKLKYNLLKAKENNLDTILTFGGAFSNHIHATAAACNSLGFKSIGVIRGEEAYAANTTLSDAKDLGMKLHFVNRDTYRRKNEKHFLETLKKKFGKFYIVPEGGSNYEGALGCSEILEGLKKYDYIFCACGTGTTFSGLAKLMVLDQKLIGVSVLKGEGSMVQETQALINVLRGSNDLSVYGNDALLADDKLIKSGVLNQFVFGGYAKHTLELLKFIDDFETRTNIPLDYVYTSKLFFAVNELIRTNKLPEKTSVLVIHSGGLQGNKGYEDRYALKPKRNVNEAQG